MMTMRRTAFGPMRRAKPAPQTPPDMAPPIITSACGHDTMPFQMKYAAATPLMHTARKFFRPFIW